MQLPPIQLKPAAGRPPYHPPGAPTRPARGVRVRRPTQRRDAARGGPSAAPGGGAVSMENSIRPMSPLAAEAQGTIARPIESHPPSEQLLHLRRIGRRVLGHRVQNLARVLEHDRQSGLVLPVRLRHDVHLEQRRLELGRELAGQLIGWPAVGLATCRVGVQISGAAVS